MSTKIFIKTVEAQLYLSFVSELKNTFRTMFRKRISEYLQISHVIFP